MSDYGKNPHCKKKVEAVSPFFMNPIKAVKPVKHTPPCKTYDSHESACSCDFKPVHKKSDCILVNKVICCKSVQKTAEFLFPFAIGPLAAGSDILAFISGIVQQATVVPNPDPNAIVQEITVLKDKIINLGYIPATLNLTLAGTTVPLMVPIRIFFQEHTDCPGVCPGDTVVETRPVVEAILNQPLIGTDASGQTFVNALLFKAIVRTTITASRQVLVDPNDHDCVHDLNERRCESTGTPETINFPLGSLTPTIPTEPTP